MDRWAIYTTHTRSTHSATTSSKYMRHTESIYSQERERESIVASSGVYSIYDYYYQTIVSRLYNGVIQSHQPATSLSLALSARSALFRAAVHITSITINQGCSVALYICYLAAAHMITSHLKIHKCSASLYTVLVPLVVESLQSAGLADAQKSKVKSLLLFISPLFVNLVQRTRALYYSGAHIYRVDANGRKYNIYKGLNGAV